MSVRPNRFKPQTGRTNKYFASLSESGAGMTGRASAQRLPVPRMQGKR
jgi:hypothetical protein